MASPCWSELPQELLGLIAARLPVPNDGARFRAVCRPWRSALRHHHVQTRQLIVKLPEGSFMTPSGGRWHPLPSFPDNTICIGSTDDWLALRTDDDAKGSHHYCLHNPFSKATVPLTALDSIIDKSRKVRKVLVRSTADDDLTVAVMISSLKCPFIVTRGGNKAWVPESWDYVYEYIIDIAFLEGKLYAITQDENLFPINIDLDGEGKLMVADGRRTIRQPPSYYGYDWWSASEDEDAHEEEGAALSDEEVETTRTSNEDYDNNVEGEARASDEDNDNNEEGEATTLEYEKAPYNDDDDNDVNEEGEATTMEYEKTPYNDDDDNDDNEEGDVTTLEYEKAPYNKDDDNDNEWEEEEEPCEENADNLTYGFEFVNEENKDSVIIVRYLVESRGKLLMVRQYVQLPGPGIEFTCRVEVFEAGVDTWVPMTNELGGGQALFLSMCFSKSVPAPCGEIEDDTIYFANTGEVFNMRSQTCSPARWSIPIPFGTWVFPPELVV